MWQYAVTVTTYVEAESATEAEDMALNAIPSWLSAELDYSEAVTE